MIRLPNSTTLKIKIITYTTHIRTPTAEEREKEYTQLKGWVDVAQRLGAGHIRVFGGTVPKSSTEEEAAGWVVEILKKSADYAGSKGVILGLENHGGITERAERIIDIVKRVDSPWVGINVDSGNFRRDAYTQLEMCVPYAVNVQMKVEVRGPSGQLEPCDWPRVMKMLAKTGYRGYAALEYESKEDPAVAVPPLLRKLNEAVRAA
jgi:sugar phosphate isomerase/epimerase